MVRGTGGTTVTDPAEERVDDHERACRDPYADEAGDPDEPDAETERVRSWVNSLFEW
jgi:hypothetical protein